MRWTEEHIKKAEDLIKEGKSYKEISNILNCSIKSLGNILCFNKIKVPLFKKNVKCLFCGNEKQEPINSARKFCSRSCSAKYNNPGRIQSELTKQKIAKSLCLYSEYIHKDKKEELCLHCNTKLNTTQRKYCSINCQIKYKENEKLKNWLNNKIVGHCNGGSYGLITVVRKWIFLRAKNKCEECGCDRINSYTKKSVLQIDHIDGDASNSRPENLKLLCPTCHAMTSTYGYNMGRRSKRYHHRKMFRS